MHYLYGSVTSTLLHPSYRLLDERTVDECEGQGVVVEVKFEECFTMVARLYG
jgi:hypothetical protein